MQQFYNWIKWFKKIIGAKIFVLLALIPMLGLMGHWGRMPSNPPALMGQSKHFQVDAVSVPSSSYTVNDFHFPTVEFAGGTGLSTYNVRNLYNVGNTGFSLLYARKTSAVTSSLNTNATPDQVIDSLVYLNQADNAVTWAVTKDDLISNLTTNRSANGASNSVATKIIFNKVVFSQATNSFFLATAAQTATHTNDQGHTVIFKINRDNGGITVYFDSARTSVNMINTGNVDYKTRPFSNIEIQRDSANPTLIVLRTQFYKTLSDNSTAQDGVQIRQEFVGMLMSEGRILNNLLNAGFSAEDTKFIEDNPNAKIIATNSFLLNNALVLITQHQSGTTLPTKAVAYSFSLNGNRFNTPLPQNLEVINNKLTTYTVWNNKGKTYLTTTSIPTQPQANQTNNSDLLMYELGMQVVVNNANLTATKISKTIPNFDGSQLKGIVPITNSRLLSLNVNYLTISNNQQLLALDANFNFVNVVALVNMYNTTGANATTINQLVSGRDYYLIYLSNGRIIAYNNSGFVGYAANLAKAEGLEAVVPISFVDQKEISNGADYFTQSFAQFQTTFQTNWRSLLQYVPAYIGVDPKLEFDFIKKEATAADTHFSEEVDVFVYQRLRNLSTDGTVYQADAETNRPRIFLGHHSYYLYNGVSKLEQKRNVFENQTILASNVAEFYNRTENFGAAITRFLTIENVDIFDKMTNGFQNVRLQFSSNDATGVLTLTVAVGFLYVNQNNNSVRLGNQTYTFNFNNFTIGVSDNDLDYTINPFAIDRINERFRSMSPSELRYEDLRNNFITLSNFLAAQTPTVQILPDEVTGTAVVTLTFNFTNPNIQLPQKTDPNLINVTRNSITWKTLSVFKQTPEINEAILLYFNTSQEIASKSAATQLMQPTAIATRIQNTATVEEKIRLITNEWNLVNASSTVRRAISDITVTRPQDLLGIFDLEITLKDSLPGTNVRSYSHSFTDFARTAKTDEDIFSVTFLNREDYLTRYNPQGSQNLFSLVPSLVTQSDLIIRNQNQLSETNGVLGGLIDISANAVQAGFSTTLAANDTTGELLVTLFFPNFIEKVQNPITKREEIQVVNSKRIYQIFTGFARSTNIQTNQTEYFLSWKSFNDLTSPDLELPGEIPQAQLPPSQLSPTEYVRIVQNLSVINRVQLFAFISATVFEKYRNVETSDLDIKFSPNDQLGTLEVNVVFNNWNFTEGITSFGQTFSGFKIDNTEFNRQVREFNPLVRNALTDRELSEIRSGLLPSQVNADILSRYFSFTGTILNNLHKIIYFIYDEAAGTAEVIFFVRTPESENQISSTPNQQLAQQTLVQHAATDVTTGENGEVTFDTSFIPRETLKEQGYVELINANALLNGFRTTSRLSTREGSIINLVIATVVPAIVFILLMPIILRLRNYILVRNVKRRISVQLQSDLENEMIRRKKIMELDESIEMSRTIR
ncbi:hypothetical protein J2Z62_000081 [Mycoplasmoides fastidiosum]|uniref:DUF31 domain-containing protein n=1 Tax=Mycoplasmoides fastidiosum TaxID=92758 RepID=A0ABU0LYF7_9BACT|nr:hypothetical protein [Mycoplasmoides fastidiosum]MDQ0513643.1 hypothetical protein [Mycoplasmoides fastidiosum]UUD37937.1 hypothetical protein NPA10_00880 [Mycoplasmoides fastidiosum]